MSLLISPAAAAAVATAAVAVLAAAAAVVAVLAAAAVALLPSQSLRRPLTCWTVNLRPPAGSRCCAARPRTVRLLWLWSCSTTAPRWRVPAKPWWWPGTVWCWRPASSLRWACRQHGGLSLSNFVKWSLAVKGWISVCVVCVCRAVSWTPVRCLQGGGQRVESTSCSTPTLCVTTAWWRWWRCAWAPCSSSTVSLCSLFYTSTPLWLSDNVSWRTFGLGLGVSTF